MNHKGVCRTALVTVGVLNRLNFGQKCFVIVKYSVAYPYHFSRLCFYTLLLKSPPQLIKGDDSPDTFNHQLQGPVNPPLYQVEKPEKTFPQFSPNQTAFAFWCGLVVLSIALKTGMCSRCPPPLVFLFLDLSLDCVGEFFSSNFLRVLLNSQNSKKKYFF